MKIYIDENLPSQLARGFNIIQEPLNHKLNTPIEVVSIKDKFSRGVKDEIWIPKVGKEQSCVITQDFNIKRIKHQRALCHQYNLGMFYLRPPKKSGFTYLKIAQILMSNWKEITHIAITHDRPFEYTINSQGKIKEL